MENGEIKLNRLYEFVEIGKARQGKKIIGKLLKVNELVHTEKIFAQGIYGEYEESVRDVKGGLIEA